ncbi:DNA-binding response regulator, NarL/FixJ family, contains REC and HTH domains [Streptomyces sp. 3213]|uniref:response regulator transcription factor n=1 Tax=Streptomyces sp. 3213.3 TaxID=1855348 RepID=UPI000897BE69|nr:response regulator transcription factor [Streptomyces sp. 3213.3]SEC36439.1 DNA-binding response regulator, NarL/FixJ family, contains REC and HTH domains [Streptomyces sp. 3213] [Streptomyces sp. 3213.3]
MNEIPGPALRILIVDDHTVVRAGLRALLESEPGFAVAGETGDGADAVHQVEQLSPDVVLMDLRLSDNGTASSGIDGVEATRRILATSTAARVVVLTSHGHQADVLRAVEAGARGYVLKAGPPEELFRAIRAAAAGGMALAPEAAAQFIGHPAESGPLLSEREIEVIRLLAHGYTNRTIAGTLHLAEATIKTHLVRIYRKLGTENRAGTVTEAVRLGLVELN